MHQCSAPKQAPINEHQDIRLNPVLLLKSISVPVHALTSIDL